MSLGKPSLGKKGAGISSTPTSGKKKILNIYWDQDTEEIVVVTED